MISHISEFFDRFHIHNDLLMAYVTILLGFNMDYSLFKENARVMLDDIPVKIN